MPGEDIPLIGIPKINPNNFNNYVEETYQHNNFNTVMTYGGAPNQYSNSYLLPFVAATEKEIKINSVAYSDDNLTFIKYLYNVLPCTLVLFNGLGYYNTVRVQVYNPWQEIYINDFTYTGVGDNMPIQIPAHAKVFITCDETCDQFIELFSPYPLICAGKSVYGLPEDDIYIDYVDLNLFDFSTSEFTAYMALNVNTEVTHNVYYAAADPYLWTNILGTYFNSSPYPFYIYNSVYFEHYEPI